MEVSKMRRIAQIACAGLGMVALSTPAFAQGGGGLNIIDIAQNMRRHRDRGCRRAVHHVVLVGGCRD